MLDQQLITSMPHPDLALGVSTSHVMSVLTHDMSSVVHLMSDQEKQRCCKLLTQQLLACIC